MTTNKKRHTYYAILGSTVSGEFKTFPYIVGERKAIEKLYNENYKNNSVHVETEKGSLFISGYGSTRTTKQPEGIISGFHVLNDDGTISVINNE